MAWFPLSPELCPSTCPACSLMVDKNTKSNIEFKNIKYNGHHICNTHINYKYSSNGVYNTTPECRSRRIPFSHLLAICHFGRGPAHLHSIEKVTRFVQISLGAHNSRIYWEINLSICFKLFHCCRLLAFQVVSLFP